MFALIYDKNDRRTEQKQLLPVDGESYGKRFTLSCGPGMEEWNVTDTHRHIRYCYSGEGILKEVIDRNGQKTVLSYENGNLRRMQTALGYVRFMANLPVIDMVRTGQNIGRLRKQAGLLVRDLQDVFGFATPQAIYKWQRFCMCAWMIFWL